MTSEEDVHCVSMFCMKLSFTVAITRHICCNSIHQMVPMEHHTTMCFWFYCTLLYQVTDVIETNYHQLHVRAVLDKMKWHDSYWKQNPKQSHVCVLDLISLCSYKTLSFTCEYIFWRHTAIVLPGWIRFRSSVWLTAAVWHSKHCCICISAPLKFMLLIKYDIYKYWLITLLWCSKAWLNRMRSTLSVV